MALPGSNIFQNPAIARYLDYAPDINIRDVPFAGDVNIPFEGRTKPVTDISEIAPTGSTQSVLAQGIANAALRNQFDFTKPFSTVVQGSGQPYIRDPNKTYDYSGYKLGNPESGIAGMGKEAWEAVKTMYGGHAPNIIANTLGDYTARYTPKLDPNHPEVMNLYDRYDFVGKMGEGKGSAYDINVNLPPELLAKIKKYNVSGPRARFRQQQLMNRRKQDMQQKIRRAEAIEAAKKTRPTNIPGTPIVPSGGGGISNINIQKRNIGMPENLTYTPPRRTVTPRHAPHPHRGGQEQSGGSAQGGGGGPPGGEAGWKGARGGYVDRALGGRSRYL